MIFDKDLSIKDIPEMRAWFMSERQIALNRVDRIERILGLPRTSEMRKQAKDNGWQKENTTYSPPFVQGESE